MVSEPRLQHLDLEHSQSIYLAHYFFYDYEKLTKTNVVTKRKLLFVFVVIMVAQDDAEIILEGNHAQIPHEYTRYNSE
jgi:hypothetical protein